ncbi:polysaccharide deacetylase family protein [Solirubrobacter ginsenosidimutans]|uniref:Polysaccharide deacetylase family protein n=1 Tax=Solirubrobacter ginsenosidimutans TaxID=490573 RepID=A0A9X3S615_9ACTN|nr:polysaccharide deacetylase family protein [Solirubrobacter ginsenosidimutans]MDA0164731.1 polysaccharide deacetylase family protein [Solirubrobacter ginsenosidimutans]
MTRSSPEIEVWVSAAPGARLDATLAALVAAGAEPRVSLVPPGEGLAAARNAALASCAAPVLALIDGDVEVAPGWLEALRDVWSGDAGEALGCVAGPLRTAFAGPRPAWLGDALLPVFGAETAGDIPAERTFAAGNLSFRAEALRGVGGFWPARGVPGLRDRFNEEHRAQHELAEAGWQSAWAPRAEAVRRIDPDDVRVRDILRLRAHTGARAGATRTATRPGTTLRSAVKAVAGTTVAVAHRDAALSVERAARAAEYAGELVAPVLADRSLGPATARTPFLHSVPPSPPGPLRTALPRSIGAVRQLRGGAPLVLLYHRVVTGGSDPIGLKVSSQHFAEQLEVLCARRTPVSLEEIVAGEAPRSAVAVSVDDGYIDAYTAIMPALEAAGVPATIFISSGHVAAGKAFWWDSVERLLRSAPADAGPLRVPIGGQFRTWPARTRAERDFAFLRLVAALRAQPPEAIDDALGGIARWAGVDDPFAPDPADRPMTVDELRRLAASPVVTIGSHGVGHACLAELSPEQRAGEFVRSKEDLHAWLGDAPAGFAYPYGVPGVDVDAATLKAASDAGYAYGVVNAPGSVSRRTDPMGVPRVAVADTGADAFDAWLSSPATARAVPR